MPKRRWSRRSGRGPPVERGPAGGRRRVVDAAGRRSGEQDEVGGAGTEAPFEGVGGTGALRSGILEATVLQHAERARAERAGGAQEQAAEHEDEPATTDDEPSQSAEHGSSVRDRGSRRYRGDP